MRIFTFLWLAPVLAAQDGGAPWNDLRVKNPAGISISFGLVDPQAFPQGDLIVADLSLPDSPLGQSPSPAERWQFAGILLDPPADCGTVAKPCFLSASGGMGLSGPQGVSAQQRLALNSYLPPLPAGRYRLAALARKLVLGKSGPASASYVYPDPQQFAVSDTVQIDIVPASAEWVRETIAKSVAALKGPPPATSAGYQSLREATQQLSFLNDPVAWTASLDSLPKEENALLEGLTRGRPPAAVCDLMQARIAAAGQSVSTSYLNRLADICARANLPPAPVSPAGTPMRAEISSTPPQANTSIAVPNAEVQAWSEKRRAYIQDLLSRASAALAASLPNKQPEAKWDGFATLLEMINQVRSNRPPERDPSWIPALTTEFVREFPSIETPRKRHLLDLYASATASTIPLFGSPDSAPFLESVLDSWKPGDYYEATRTALCALYRVDPVRARKRILAELVKEKTWLDVPSLELLPPSEVPAMDDALIDSLTQARRDGGWNPQLRKAAIALYATPQALARIRSIYESEQTLCQPELVAYFVRVDPAYSERVFNSAPPACATQYFTRTPPLSMNSALEQYISAYLMMGDVPTKSAAAKVLARYGTPAGLARVWEAFRYFHDYWNGKRDELEQNFPGVALEVDLRNAIARGRGWIATETNLRLIESLCISGRCVQETRQDLGSWKAPLRIEITPQSFGIFGRIAQYSGLDSVEAVESKLMQFARGTQFVLYAPSGQNARATEEIRRFAVEKGLVLTIP